MTVTESSITFFLTTRKTGLFTTGLPLKSTMNYLLTCILISTITLRGITGSSPGIGEDPGTASTADSGTAKAFVEYKLGEYTCVNGICHKPNPDSLEDGYIVGCEDVLDDCTSIKCETFYERHACPRTCQTCHETSYKISKSERFGIYPDGDFEIPSIQDVAGEDLGVLQHINYMYSERLMKKLEETREYIRTNNYSQCKAKDQDCLYWAFGPNDECKTNPKYMLTQCAPYCRSCDKIESDR